MSAHACELSCTYTDKFNQVEPKLQRDLKKIRIVSGSDSVTSDRLV